MPPVIHQRHARIGCLVLVLALTLGFLPSNVTSMCPFISQTMYTESISESVPIGTTLLTIAATGNTLTYTLVPLPGISNFHVDPSTGNITLSVSLDYETTTSYVFAVTVGNVTCTQTVLIYIDVIDENDHSPECTESRLYTHVPDNSTEGYLVSLNCTDGDNYPLRYEILSGNEIGIFAINAQGEVAVTAILDYENKTLYELSIIVSDSGLLPEQNTTVDIFVIVDPVNEYRPDFENDAIELYISESAGIGALVGHISASDLDSGEDGSITYTIVSEDESDVFAICSQTGNIYISRMLDYESISTYQFRVMASDTSLVETSRLSSTATVTVHVLDSNDHSPMFTKSVYYAQVPEDTETASEILQVVCLDEDSGSNQEVNYTIMSGNEGGNFGISSQGIITFDSSILLNFDDAGTILYELTVECKDSGQPQLNSQSLVILEVTSVNERDPIPQFIEFTASIGEDTSPGTSIAHIQANDQDRGLAGVIIYSLNFNSDCPDELLYIDSATGMVFLISPLDYETGLVYVDCVVTVRDSQPPVRASETDLVITVTDVNDEPPVCSPSAQTFSLPEDTPVGYSLTFTCNDADSTSLQYSVTNGYSVFPFELSPSGTLVTLVLQSELDYENNTMHILPVEVSDGDFTTKVTVYISVFGINEHTPIFLNDSFECSVSEATELGAIVCETGAYDEDSGIDGVVMYQMANSIGTFATDLHTGIIFLTDSLDYETTKEYNITIQAFDSGNPSLSSSVQAHIIVIDENDNVPMTQPLIFAKISENALSGSHVTALDCFDLDDGRNAETDFEITGTFIFLENGEYLLASNQTFTMSSPGNLTLNESLDYEAAHLYKVVVTCKDHGVLPLSSCATITIEVLPENEFNPTFSQHARSISIPENTPIGTSVFQVIASDNDSGKDGSIQYSLHSNDSLFLAMDSSSGIVSVVSPMDCLRGTVYNTTIIATDGGRIPLSAETMLTVYIANCSLGHVTSEKAVYIASVHETAHIGTSILNVACNSTRADLLSERYTTTYEILSAESSLFAIDSTSGELSVASSLDYETSISHVVTLQCYDPNNPHSLASFTAYIAILPENEHPPIFPSFSYSIEIPENTTLGASILTVEAHDMDNGQDGILSYSIRDLDKPVGIDPVSGAVYLTDFLDRETTDHFTFTVNVQDTPIEQEYTKHAHVDVAVLISDSNDNNPQCERNFYHVSVSPWTRIGTSLVNLTCSDRDLEQNSQLEYTLTDNSTTELFRIDRYTGEAILLQVLDPDISVVYHVPVSVRDMGEPPLSITVVIIVDVQDSVSTEDDEVDVTDVISQTQTEGFENAVTILLQDLSLQLWQRKDTEKNFQMAIARSVTHYCALLPEACSLITGCAEFYGSRNKRNLDDTYISFMDPNVILIAPPSEMITTDDTSQVTSLEVQFYVILPESAIKAPVRETDFVVPRGTLNQIVQQDSMVIEAVVRDSVAPPLTEESDTTAEPTNKWQDVAISALVFAAVLISVIAVVLVAVVVTQYKKRAIKKSKVVPISINKKGSQNTAHNSVHKVTPHKSSGNNKPSNSIQSDSKRGSDATAVGSVSPSDSQCSLITLDDEHDSMEPNGRGSLSEREILNELESIKSHREGNGLPAYDPEPWSSTDYLENWPWPPRLTDRPLRPGHARTAVWTMPPSRPFK